MHYMRINFATQGLTGKAAERGGEQGAGRQQRADGTLSLRAGRAERLRLHHDQPRESRTTGTAC